MPKRDGPRPPWYGDGLRFECQPGCGQCCVNHGEWAYVYLEGDDGPRLARHLGLDLATFHGRYTEQDEGRPILRMDQPACPFLDGARCTVYEARPAQCRTFPFWETNLRTPRTWERLRAFCPGIGRGKTHSLRVIRRQLAELET
jgi:Fe-S-cluster containining protein